MPEEKLKIKKAKVEKKNITVPVDKKIITDKSTQYLAAVRLRGGKRIHIHIMDTLEMLNLRNQHNLIIVPNKPNMIGMLQKAKDYITWGLISAELKAEIESKKTEKTKNNKPQKYFRLQPPRHGFEKKGIKTSYSQGGALGERPNMENLLKRMI